MGPCGRGGIRVALVPALMPVLVLRHHRRRRGRHSVGLAFYLLAVASGTLRSSGTDLVVEDARGSVPIVEGHLIVWLLAVLARVLIDKLLVPPHQPVGDPPLRCMLAR